MGSIRAALSGNTTGRQLLFNLKGAGDFLTWGQIYKPFPHTHTHTEAGTQPLAFHLRSGAVLRGHAGFRARQCRPRGAQRVWRARTRQDSGCQALILLPTALPGAFCRGELQQRSRALFPFIFPIGFSTGTCSSRCLGQPQSRGAAPLPSLGWRQSPAKLSIRLQNQG